MRKVERLVNLTALLLDTPRPLTLDEVAEMVPGYEASGESLRRMFERDKEELRGLGVPVERAAMDAWGSDEGYFIDLKAYGMPELRLDPDERAALALAARAWSGAGLDPAAVSGHAKLDLDTGAGGEPVRADLAGGSPLVAALLEAVTNRKRIAFTYQPPGREPAERHLVRGRQRPGPGRAALLPAVAHPLRRAPAARDRARSRLRGAGGLRPRPGAAHRRRARRRRDRAGQGRAGGGEDGRAPRRRAGRAGRPGRAGHAQAAGGRPRRLPGLGARQRRRGGGADRAARRGGAPAHPARGAGRRCHSVASAPPTPAPPAACSGCSRWCRG